MRKCCGDYLFLSGREKKPPWRTEVHGIWEGVIKIQPTGIKGESVDVIQKA
jgi:hypothetical protein